MEEFSAPLGPETPPNIQPAAAFPARQPIYLLDHPRRQRAAGPKQLLDGQTENPPTHGVRQAAERPPSQAQPSLRVIIRHHGGIERRLSLGAEVISVEGEQGGAPGQRLAGPRIESLQGGQQLGPHGISTEGGILIRSVVTGLKAMGLAKRRRSLTGLRQQGASEIAAPGPHGRQPIQAAAPEQMEEDRFRLIVLGVAGGNAVRAHPCLHRPERRIP
jgi:hypothetical protein